MDWSVLWQYRAALWSGVVTTVWVSAVAIVGATLVGVLIGCLGTLPSYLLRRLTTVYAEVLRNLPLIVKLFFLYFVAGLPGLPAAIAALVLHQSAYISDLTKAGIRSVARGQFEAGLSLGHGYWQTFRYIIIPQMIPVMVPPMTTQYVAVVKNSAVIALIAVQDLTFETQEINVQTFRGFEAATAATAIYVLIALAIIGAMQWAPKRAPSR